MCFGCILLLLPKTEECSCFHQRWVTEDQKGQITCAAIMKSGKWGAGTQIFQKLVQFINQLLDVIPFLGCHPLKPPQKYLINRGELSQEGWDCSFNKHLYTQLIPTGANDQSNKSWKMNFSFSAALQHHQKSQIWLLKHVLKNLISALQAFMITWK